MAREICSRLKESMEEKDGVDVGEFGDVAELLIS